MESFGILDFALPFGAVALVLLGWMGIGRLGDRRARAAPAAERGRETDGAEPARTVETTPDLRRS